MKNQNEIQTVEVIDFNKQKTAAINLDTLSNSVNDITVSGKPKKSRPIPHHEFIGWMQDEFSKQLGGESMIEAINISAGHAKKMVYPGDAALGKNEPCPVDRLNISRLVCRVYNPIKVQVGKDDFCPAFGVSYNERGIEVSYGTNVWACSNMNIFGSKRWSTYGNGKIEFEELQDNILGEMSIWKDSFDQDIEIIQQLQATPLPKAREMEAVAQLFRSAVHANMNGRQRDAILNISQCTRLQEELFNRADKAHEELSFWDLTQAGTEHLKPENNDMIELYPTIDAFNKWALAESYK